MRLLDNSGSNSNGQIKMSCTTPVQLYFRQRTYTAGQVGASDTWQKFETFIGEKITDILWVDWRGSYGSQQIQSMSMGVYDLCTIRMDYHPQLYELMRRKEMLIIKNAAQDAIEGSAPVRNHPDVYTLWGSVDDIRNLHKIMEFKVRRWEAK